MAMSMIETVRSQMMEAMKNRDKDRKDALSMLLSALKNKAIDKRADLTEAEEFEVVKKEIRQTRETMELAPEGRDDIKQACQLRLDVYQEFAPEEMSGEAIREQVKEVLAALGIAEPSGKDKGKVMKELMPRVKGRADGGLVNKIVGDAWLMKSPMTTLCYIEQDGRYLMLHRVSKENDINKDKWIGVGGHFEPGESPEECLLREVKEETGLTLLTYRFRGIVTFCSDDDPAEYMCLYTADAFEGNLTSCDEGTLQWVEKDKIGSLNLWDGDVLFLDLLRREVPFFSLKLSYKKDGTWYRAVLDGKELELLDICKPDGTPAGHVKERSMVHRSGDFHRTVHMWVIRRREDGGVDVLLQKRSKKKDSYPGHYDISSAGHVHAGDSYEISAVREIGEELGIVAKPEDFRFIGFHEGCFEKEFWGELFINHELSAVYLYEKPVKIAELPLQESEVEEVVFMDYGEILQGIKDNSLPNCIYPEEFGLIKKALEPDFNPEGIRIKEKYFI